MFSLKHQLREVLYSLPLLVQSMHLVLPASEKSIARQVSCLSQTLRTLERNVEQVFRLKERGIGASYQQLCSQIIGFLRELMMYTDTLIHLAQEHAVDPEGTVRCLAAVVVDDAQFLRQVAYFQVAIAHVPMSPWQHAVRLMSRSARSLVH